MQGKKDTYERYFVNKKVQRRKERVFLQVNWLRIFIFILVLCAVGLSLTVFLIYSKNDVRYYRKAFYFLQLHEYGELEIAQNAANNVKSDGGAGFILIGDKFRVMAFVYPNESEASKVATRLNASGENASVYTCEFGDRYLTGYDDKQKTKKIQEYINKVFSTFDKLYEICIKLDKESVSESLAIKETNALVDIAEMSVFNLRKEDFGERGDRLIKVFTELNAGIKKGLTISGTDKVSQHLKYTLCNVAIIIKDNMEILV